MGKRKGKACIGFSGKQRKDTRSGAPRSVRRAKPGDGGSFGDRVRVVGPRTGGEGAVVGHQRTLPWSARKRMGRGLDAGDGQLRVECTGTRGVVEICATSSLAATQSQAWLGTEAANLALNTQLAYPCAQLSTGTAF
eukprot:EG_transcript_32559